MKVPAVKYTGLWKYRSVLPPIKEKNIITSGEGEVAIERWNFLEKFALNSGIKCKVYAHRQDTNPETGSFKDLSASLIASFLKENNVSDYVIASTGNMGVSVSRYLSKAGIKAHIFVPAKTSDDVIDMMLDDNQAVYRIEGTYEDAKKEAAKFAKKNKMRLSAGSCDPLRIAAKKTMVYEWYRKIKSFPTVYIQATSGGTGALSVAQGIDELLEYSSIYTSPRLLLCQPDKCSPMVDAWKKALKKKFPFGWENDYPKYTSTNTVVSILSTLNPTAYPKVAKIVKKSGGSFLSVPEKELPYVSVYLQEQGIEVGFATLVAVGGFIEALNTSKILDNDTVLINIGD